MQALPQPEKFLIQNVRHGERAQDLREERCPEAVNSRCGSSQSRKADQESGESTGRRVVVLRKPPSSQVQSSVILQGKVHKSENFSVGKSSPCLPKSSKSTKGRVSKTFRVPSGKTEFKPKAKGSLCVNAWKEYLLGTSVLHPKIITFDRWENGCDTWYKLWCAYTAIISSCSYYSMWIKRLLLYTLRIFLPVTGGKLYFCYFRHNHISIHKKGEEQSLNIKFHGSPFQGVTLYFARICCPFCAAESQRTLTMKYFQSTVMERRYMMRHKLAT
ncbi:uncharacterized protein [Macrobrachium rosenbergii]|uniref:uncharacterized protein n=1 Tax=Macrobrachium rosenbergii TaxID=79674 RepID=UPI0034D6A259